MEIKFFDPSEFLLGFRVEQGEYQAVDENNDPVGEPVEGRIYSIGLGFCNIHIYTGDLK